MDFLEVDGSYGEGGGQILRTAHWFSIVQNKPIHITKIRAGRAEPGLKRQHVSSLEVLARVFDCELTGAVEGSRDVRFVPGQARQETLSLSMGTAASITLVLQAVIPAVALSKSRLSIELGGGTDVPWSPTFDYLSSIVKDVYAVIGVNFEARAQRRGYYPKGGGLARVTIVECTSLRPLRLVQRLQLREANIVSRCSVLPRHVAERQAKAASSVLSTEGVGVRETEIAEEAADSPGSSILVSAKGSGFFLGADAIGAKGKSAEAVGEDAARRMIGSIRSGACIDTNLADMVAPLLSLAKGPSELRVPHVSQHLETGLHLARLFTGCEYSTKADEASFIVSIMPK